MNKKYLYFPALLLLMLSGEAAAGHLKNEFFGNRLCSPNRYRGCYEMDEFGIRNTDPLYHRPEWTCVLSKDEGAHVVYECKNLNRGRSYRIDVYSVGKGADGKCRAYLREELTKDMEYYKRFKKKEFLHGGGILDMYLQTEATECGDTTVPPPLHRRWRYAPKVPDKEFKNPRFGQYYWQGNEKYTADKRLYPNKIAEYEEGGLFEESECALIENEEDRIVYECDSDAYDDVELYMGKGYYYYTLTVYNEGEEIEAVHMVERHAEDFGDSVMSRDEYAGYRKGRFE